MKRGGLAGNARRPEAIQEESEPSEQDNNKTELTRIDQELCRQNFQFYDKNRVGYVERFELPMLLNGMLVKLKN